MSQGRWRTRGASAIHVEGEPVDTGTSPTTYITNELIAVASLGVEASDKFNGLEHLGNAFHTIEDFFAHSNFVELVNHDYKFGRTLLTGNFESADSAVSLSHVIESVSTPEAAQQYQEGESKAVDKTAPLSHSRIAHDHPSSHNYAMARRIAALVIQELSSDIISLMAKPVLFHQRLMNEVVIAKVLKYLRPPAEDNKWWETLQTA